MAQILGFSGPNSTRMGECKHEVICKEHALARLICFLLDTKAEPHNDNHERLPRAFESAGWKVLRSDQAHLCFEAGQVCIRTPVKSLPLEEFDRIWHLGLGRKASFLDRMELLAILPSKRFVTPPRALALQHGKLHLLDPRLADMLPQTIASSDATHLASTLDLGEWVIKPAAGSLGRGITRIRGDDAGLLSLLQKACEQGFVLAQRYVPCRNEPEVRVLFARGQAIGSYGRIAKHNSPSNLARGATAIRYQVGPELDEKVARVGAWLQGEGIGFAAADFRGNHLIEINIANPGGLGTIERLTGVDLSATLVERLETRGVFI